MKPILLAVVFGIFSNLLFGQNPNLQWANVNHSTNDQWLESMIVDDDGNLFSCTQIYGEFDLDPSSGVDMVGTNGVYSIALQKLDANGNYVWGKAFPITNLSLEGGLQLVDVDQNDNIILIYRISNGTIDLDPGSGNQDRVSNNSYSSGILKLDSNGDYVSDFFYESIGTSNHFDIRSAYMDPNGTIYLFGRGLGVIDLDPGSNTTNSNGSGDYFLKINTNSDLEWSRKWERVTNLFEVGIIGRDSNGAFYFECWIDGTYDIDPGATQVNQTGAGQNFIVLDANGIYQNYIPTEIDYGVVENNFKFAVSPLGKIFVLGSSIASSLTSLDIDPGAGSYIVSRANNGLEEFQYLICFDQNGSMEWAYDFRLVFEPNQFTGSVSNHYMINDFLTDDSGNIYFTGAISDYTICQPQSDSLIVADNTDSTEISIGKISHDGNLEFVFLVGGIDNDYGSHIDLGPNNEIYASGGFENQGDFDPNSGSVILVASGGAYNIWSAKYDATFLSTLSSKKSELIIYPNPAKDHIRIKGIEDKSEVLIFDMNGRLLRDLKVNSDQIIDVSNLSPGMYLIKVREGNQEFNERIIIE